MGMDTRRGGVSFRPYETADVPDQILKMVVTEVIRGTRYSRWNWSPSLLHQWLVEMQAEIQEVNVSTTSIIYKSPLITQTAVAHFNQRTHTRRVVVMNGMLMQLRNQCRGFTTFREVAQLEEPRSVELFVPSLV